MTQNTQHTNIYSNKKGNILYAHHIFPEIILDLLGYNVNIYYETYKFDEDRMNKEIDNLKFKLELDYQNIKLAAQLTKTANEDELKLMLRFTPVTKL